MSHPFILGNGCRPPLSSAILLQSCRNEDKWANVPHQVKGGLPVLDKAVAYLRCKVTDAKELSTHTAFFCEVTDAWLGEGDPLIYGNYQKEMKTRTMEAFKAFKETGTVPSDVKKEKWVCKI